MEKMNAYIIVSFNWITVTTSVTEMLSCLYYWPEAPADVYALKTLEEANILAPRVYYAKFFGHPRCFQHTPLAIPSAGPYSLQAPEASFLPPQQKDVPRLAEQQEEYGFTATNTLSSTDGQTKHWQAGPLTLEGAWSVVGTNGYAVDSNPVNLMGLLTDTLSYAHATWWANPQHASLWAQREYAERCGRCVDIRNYIPHFPMKAILEGERYIDTGFDVLARMDNNPIVQKLHQVGLI